MTVAEQIKNTIEAKIPQSTAHILDPNNDGQHFQAIVVSSAFEGLLLVKQHQMVLGALKEAFATTVHAIQLKTFTPQKWQDAKHQFNL